MERKAAKASKIAGVQQRHIDTLAWLMLAEFLQ
jgi:hypothetical protein